MNSKYITFTRTDSRKTASNECMVFSLIRSS